MKKTKPKSEPSFIKFSKMQTALLTKIVTRYRERKDREEKRFYEEFNKTVGMIYKELGIADRILRPDFTGVDIFPVKKEKGKSETCLE